MCELCNAPFTRKENLLRHMNKLRKCTIATDFECEWCSKSFTAKCSLNRHLTTCKAKRHHDELELLIQQETQATNDKLEELESKYKLLEEKINIPAAVTSEHITHSSTINGNHNSTSNNRSHNPINSHNTNNITINNYGCEDMTHMNLKRITFVFNKSFNSVVECVKLKHFSPLAPQNKNVCIKDLKSKYAYVFYDGNWDVIGSQ